MSSTLSDDLRGYLQESREAVVNFLFAFVIGIGSFLFHAGHQ